MKNNTDLNTQQNQNDFYLKVLIAIFALVFSLLAFFVAMNLYKNNSTSKKTAVKTTISPSIKKQMSGNGSISLSSDIKNSLKTNSELLINTTMSSDKKSVIGFDTVILFDESKSQFLGIVSNNDNYDIRGFVKKGNVLYVTGIKKTSVDKEIVFNNDLVFKARFKSLKSGKSSFYLDFKANSTKDSNIIDKNNNDVLGKVDNLSVNVIE